MQATISRTTASSQSRPAAPRWIGTVLVYVILLVAMVIAVFPILVMLLDSIKPTPLITATPPVWIFTPTWEHYQNVLQIPRIFHAQWREYGLFRFPARRPLQGQAFRRPEDRLLEPLHFRWVVQY